MKFKIYSTLTALGLLGALAAIQKPGTVIHAESSELILFENGIFYDATGATNTVTFGASGSVADGKFKNAGTYTPDRALLTTKIDLSGYDSVKVTYTATGEKGWGEFCLANLPNSWGEFDYVGKGTTFVIDGTENTATFTLSDYDGATITDAWGADSHSGADTLNLAEIGGFAIKSNAIVSVSKIVAVKEDGGDEPFDPTPVDNYIFGNTSSVDEAGGDAGITDGTGNKAVYGTNSGAKTAARIADGENYAVKFTGVNLIRYDTAASFSLVEAMLNNGWVEFDLSFETLPTATSFQFTSLDGSGDWGERYATKTSVNVAGTAGEYHTYKIELKDLEKYTSGSSWEINDATKRRLIDYSIMQGFGFYFGDEDVTVSIRNIHYGYTPVERSITGIEASTTKTSYNAGSAFDRYSFSCNVIFNDGNKAENITNFKVLDIGKVTTDNKTVEISFTHGGEKYTKSVELTVNTATSLTIKTQPTKVAYKEGEALDLTGIVVTATMSDESTLELGATDLEADVDFFKAGDTKVTLSYAGASVELPVTVTALAGKYSYFDNSYVASYDAEKGATIKEGYSIAGGASIAKDGDDYYFTSNNSNTWTNARFVSWDGNLNVGKINDEDAAVYVYVTYRTSAVSSATFKLFNSTKYLDYKNATVNFNTDGEWHVAKIAVDNLIGKADGGINRATDEEKAALDNVIISAREIVGWGIAASGKIDIKSVAFKWDADSEAKWNDTAKPTITYNGEQTINQNEGEAPNMPSATAHDSHDGDITPTYTWSEDALDENGKLTAGTHTLTISAEDAAGNKADSITITYIVKDVVAPVITYTGEKTITQTEGETPNMPTVTAHDSHDGNITPTYSWSDGALDANGKLVKGTHTLTYNATDAAGNKATPLVITFVVNEKKVEPPVSSSEESSSSSKESSSESKPASSSTSTPSSTDSKDNGGSTGGCGGSIVAGSATVGILAAAAAGLLIYKKKKEDK